MMKLKNMDDRQSESEPISIRITFHLCRSDWAIDSESVSQSESQTHSVSDSVTVTHSLVTVTRLV